MFVQAIVFGNPELGRPNGIKRAKVKVVTCASKAFHFIKGVSGVAVPPVNHPNSRRGNFKGPSNFQANEMHNLKPPKN